MCLAARVKQQGFVAARWEEAGMSKRTLLALVMLALALIMSGCQTSGLKTPKVLPDWSRGHQVGVSALNWPIDMVPEDDYVHMISVAADSKALHYVRLDGTGDIQVSTDVAVGGAHPSAARLLLNADGSLGVLWTDNPNIPRALFLARLSREGQLLTTPARLSPEGARVSNYAVARNLDGSHDIFWATDIPTEGGIYHLRVSDDAQTASANRLLVQNGGEPTLQVAADGMIHLAWAEEPTLRLNDVYYAVFDPSTGELGPKTRVGFYKTSTGLISYPPVLGLDNSTVYLFWALEQRGGGLVGAGNAETYMVSFPLNRPAFMEALTVDIPGAARPTYNAAAGSLPYQRLASADAGWPTSLLYMPTTLGGQREELGVFLAGQVATRNQSSREVLWGIFSNGDLKGYQLPTKLGNALRPTGVIDGRGNVHLAWLNSAGFGRYDVYYASTSDAIKANLDGVTMQDRGMDFLNALWSLAPALGFFPPVLLLWSFASFFWIIIFYFVKTEGGLDRRPAQIALVVAILLYLFSKLFLMPGVVLSYAPFLDSLPGNLQFISQLGTPLLTLLAALGALWLYFRRRPYRSLFAAWVIVVLTDALLSLIIYVPRWLAG
jgi:hypothetical protein